MNIPITSARYISLVPTVLSLPYFLHVFFNSIYFPFSFLKFYAFLYYQTFTCVLVGYCFVLIVVLIFLLVFFIYLYCFEYAVASQLLNDSILVPAFFILLTQLAWLPFPLCFSIIFFCECVCASYAHWPNLWTCASPFCAVTQYAYECLLISFTDRLTLFMGRQAGS